MRPPPSTTPGSTPRRKGDDPFLPEQELLWWAPRVAVLLVILILLGWGLGSILHHRGLRLARQDGQAVLQRGTLSLRGWGPWIPDGAVAAWAPVPWTNGLVEPPVPGELEDLAPTFAGLLREAGRATADLAAVERLAAQERALQEWHRTRWGGDLPGGLELGALLAERTKPAPVVPPPPVSLEKGRAYNQARRALLLSAERLLGDLPPFGAGNPTEERDRAAIEAFILSMDTPTP